MIKKLIRFFFGATLSLVLFIGISIGAATLIQQTKQPVESATHVDDTIQPNRHSELDLRTAQPISILIAGLDTGALMYEDEEISRTDTLMLMTLNPLTKQTTLTSIPRDTWMPIDDDQTFDKINHAYVFGGIKQTHRALENYLGVPIDYYLTVDMKAFIEGIDTMGGLTLTPNQSFKQDGSTFIENDTRLYSGTEVMNYVRMRKYDEDGDNGRQVRQQQVISEMLAQYITLDGVIKIPKIYRLFIEHVDTNISVSDIFNMYQQYVPAIETIRSLPFTQYDDITRHGIYYMYIDDMHRNTIHKALARTLMIEEAFNPIIYPVDQIHDQPYLNDKELHHPPLPSGIYSMSELIDATQIH